jgi:hypothetical protein
MPPSFRRKLKFLLAVLLLNGIFLLSQGQNTYAAYATSSYQKAYNATLSSQNWNDLFSDFANTWTTTSLNGPVGIGTTNPGVKLDIRDVAPQLSIGNNQGVNVRLNNVVSTIFFPTYSGTDFGSKIDSYVGGYSDQTDLRFYTDTGSSNPATEKMRITSGGNVGIGTTNPTIKLSVSGGTGNVINAAGGFVNGLNSVPVNSDQAVPLGYLQANYAPIGSGVGAAFVQGGNSFGGTATLGTNDNNLLNFKTNNAVNMTIAAGGNVGIGTANPGGKLDIHGNGTTTGITLQTSDSTGAAKVTLLDNGNVGIGTAGPGAKLGIGSTGFSLTNLSDGMYVNGIHQLGNSVGNYSYPSEALVQATSNTIRLQAAAYRRDAGSSWLGTGYRLQYAVDNSFTDGSMSYTEMGGRSTGEAYLVLGTSGSDRLYINATGNVGIGTTAPAQKLDIAGNININTSGTSVLISSFVGANSTGKNIFIGGGGQSSVGAVGATYQGSSNTAYGVSALNLNTTGYSNTANGLYALTNNTTGNANTAYGVSALNLNTTGSSNVALGYAAGYNETSSNHFYVGNVQQSSLANDQAYSLMYGTFSGTAGSLTGQQLVINGNVGIGTTNPTIKLAVSGGTGNVINAGGGFVNGLNSTPVNTDQAVPLGYLQSNYAPIGSGAGSAFVQGGNSFGGTANLGTNDNNILNFETNSATRMTVAAGGNVGIGVTNPNATLTVGAWVSGGNQNLLSLQPSDFTTTANRIIFSRTTDNWTPAAIGQIYDGSYGGVLSFQTHAPNGVLGNQTSPAERMRIDSNGNVGIGVTNPTGKLHVVGSTASAFPATSGTTQTGLYARFQNSDSNLILDMGGNGGNGVWMQATNLAGFNSNYPLLLNPNGGNVGVGTTNPAGAKLVVNGNIQSNNGLLSSYTQSVNTNWSSYINTNIDARGAHMINVYFNADNATWKGTFLAQGENSYTPNEIWNNVKLVSWSGYGTSVDDVQVLIMSNTATTSYGAITLVIKTNRTAGVTAAMTVTVTGGNASQVNLASSTAAPFTYAMVSSANTYQIYQMSTGYVGIGTTNPTIKLSVSGGTGNVINTGGGFVNGLNSTPVNTDQAVPLGYLQSNYAPIGSGVGAAFVQGGNSFGGTANLGTNDNNILNFETNNATRMTLNTSGNLGIGTTNPNAKLHIFNSTATSSPNEVSRLEGYYNGANTGPLLRFTNYHPSGTNPNALEYNLAGIAAYDYSTSWDGALAFFTAPSGTSGGGNLQQRMTIIPNGNVGIGTTSPGAKLQIDVTKAQASNGTDGLWIRNTVAAWDAPTTQNLISMRDYSDVTLGQIKSFKSATGIWGFSFDGYNSGVASDLVTILGSGNVGIGTTGPGASLEIAKAVPSLYFTRTTADTTSAADIQFRASDGTVKWQVGSQMAVAGSNFEINEGLSTNNRFVIKTGGNVGIGTTAPGARLDVSGNVLLGGENIGGGYSPIPSSLAASGKMYVGWNRSSGGGEVDVFANRGGGGTGGFRFIDYTNAGVENTLVTILGSGNVGIGLTNPTIKLSVSGGTGNVINAAGGFVNGLNSTPVNTDQAVPLGYLQSNYAPIGSGAGSAFVQGGNSFGGAATLGTADNNLLNFKTNNAVNMTISAAGNVGIGTTNPTAKFQLTGGMVLNHTGVADTDYTALTTDYIIAYTSLSANRTVTLPNALCTPGRFFVILDESGNSSPTKEIIIAPTAGTTIVGQTNFILANPYNSVYVFCGNSAWYVL